MKKFLTGLAFACAAWPAFAFDTESRDAEGSVAEVMDRLQAAVEEAGATVFARVPHSKGAASVDMELADAELLIFGNPTLGTPVLQENILAGLVLPLRVLVYDDDGQTRIAWQEVEEMLEELDIDDDLEAVGKRSRARSTS